MNDNLGSQRTYYARAVFDGEIATNQRDFDPKTASMQTIAFALGSENARVRMRAIIMLAIKGNVNENEIVQVFLMKEDKGVYDYLAGKVYGPSRFCPSVSYCAELFLPVIFEKSPSGILSLISMLSHNQDNSIKRIMDIVSACGIINVAIALAVSENVSIDSLTQVSTMMAGKVPDIPQLLNCYLENPTKCHAKIVQFLASKSPKYLLEFLTTILEYGEKATPWLLEGIPYQTDKYFCSKLSKKCGPPSIPWLIEGLSSPNKRTILACAYSLSLIARNSEEAHSALLKATEQETRWLVRWQLNGDLKRISR